MRLNLEVDRRSSVVIQGGSYPVQISGKGIPCLAIGLGTLAQRTLSPEFKRSFQVHSSDLYWDARHGLSNPHALTLEKILEDISSMLLQLNLSGCILFGHSAFGIIALEFVKRFPSEIQGIILSGTPVNSNPEIARINDACFQQLASKERKLIDCQRKKEMDLDDLSKYSYAERFLKRYAYRDAARYWHDPSFDCSPLWQDSIVDPVLDHFFANILPAIDAASGLQTIERPIFLAAGMSDFDCCPWHWETVPNLPRRMSIQRYLNSGHYPHYEEHQLFDAHIKDWIGNNH